MSMNYILMADIIKSSGINSGKSLMESFQKVTKKINKENRHLFLSPITITLGDEFQAVVANIESGVRTIIAVEEALLAMEKPFTLRYVLNYGEIETQINPKIAYEMLGKGLTRTREMIVTLKKYMGKRFLFELQNHDETAFLNNLFILYQHFYDRWQKRDSVMVTHFLELKDYKKVADVMGRDTSLIWRREKSLCIKEYLSLKQVLLSSHQFFTNE